MEKRNVSQRIDAEESISNASEKRIHCEFSSFLKRKKTSATWGANWTHFAMPPASAFFAPTHLPHPGRHEQINQLWRQRVPMKWRGRSKMGARVTDKRKRESKKSKERQKRKREKAMKSATKKAGWGEKE